MKPNLNDYDRILIAFSGGKDSIASYLHLIDCGVDPKKIELHHHLVDGREGSALFDWPCTESYCREVARIFGLPIYFSWLEGGLEREMCRDNQPKARTWFETPNDGLKSTGGKGKPGSRRRFPAKSANLTQRWCSSYAKIDVMSAAIAGQSRFNHTWTLVVTGERAEESPGRAKYAEFEEHRSDRRSGNLRRHVDHWRPVHQWGRNRVWERMAIEGIVAHPAYHLGFGRLSCQRCIFGSPNQWATNFHISPAETQRMADYEEDFQFTLDRKFSLPELAAKGSVYSAIAQNEGALRAALRKEYVDKILVPPDEWQMPAGAFGENNGPI
jgi:hypothetical protein